MIVFDLICRDQHRFEGWFASADDFASQRSRGLLACPVCGAVHVEKLPTAKIRKQADAATAVQASVTQTSEATVTGISRVIDYVLAHTEDVGRSFAEEARKIFYEEAPQRNIRGVATRAEADNLRDEGVPVFSLPVPPQDRWN
jgi:hypothetical protein